MFCRLIFAILSKICLFFNLCLQPFKFGSTFFVKTTAPIARKIIPVVPGDVWYDVVKLLETEQYGLFAVVSHVLNAAVGHGLRIRRKEMGPFEICRSRGRPKCAVIKSKEHRDVKCLLPKTVPPPYITGFKHIIIRFVDEDVVAFVDRFRRRKFLDNLQLIVIKVEESRNVSYQTLLDTMAPSIKSLEGYLQKFVTQQYLQRCSSLEYIQVWDAFDHNNLGRDVDGKPMNDKEGRPLYRTLIDWVTCEGQAEAAANNLRLLEFLCVVTLPQELATDFQNATKPVTYAIGHDNKPFNGIRIENNFTNEAFRYNQHYDFQLRRGPEHWSENQWLKKITQIAQKTEHPNRKRVIRLEIEGFRPLDRCGIL